jgi:hypothetical protein
MNLLSVANEINAELAIIRANNSRILSEQRRADIFNSIVICLTDGLVDTIKLSLVRKNRELLSWHYDLRNGKSIQRRGPSLQEIITEISNVSEEAYFDCQVQWSQTFEAMDSQTKKRLLRNTIWDEPRDNLNEDSRGNQLPSPQVKIDWTSLESDLRNLESHTELISPRMIASILESVQQSFSKGYIVGIKMLLSNPEEQQPAIEWGFEFRPDSGLIRQGPPVEKILRNTGPLRERSKLEIKPILSTMFETLSSGDKESAMKGTIWQSDFQDRQKGSWWSR